jgi:hypothetical protein
MIAPVSHPVANPTDLIQSHEVVEVLADRQTQAAHHRVQRLRDRLRAEV